MFIYIYRYIDIIQTFSFTDQIIKPIDLLWLFSDILDNIIFQPKFHIWGTKIALPKSSILPSVLALDLLLSGDDRLFEVLKWLSFNLGKHKKSLHKNVYRDQIFISITLVIADSFDMKSSSRGQSSIFSRVLTW